MRVLVLAAVLALAACSKAPQPPTGTVTTTTTASQSVDQSGAKPGPDQAVQSTPVAVIDRDFLIGRWGDNGDCTKDVVLNADNSFTSYNGGEGEWSLNGATLHMAGKQNAYDLQLELIDHNTIQVTNPDGSVGHSQRCQ